MCAPVCIARMAEGGWPGCGGDTEKRIGGNGSTMSRAWPLCGSARARERRSKQFRLPQVAGRTARGTPGDFTFAIGGDWGLDKRHEWNGQVCNRWMEGEGELWRGGDGVR